MLLCTAAILFAANEPAAERARRAGVAMNEGRFAEAIGLWQVLVREQPGNNGLRLSLGLALHGAGRCREAAVELERALANGPDTTGAMTILGDCYIQLKEPKKAITAFEGALAAEPRNEDAQRELAVALRQDGQYRKALELLRVLAPRDRSNPHVWRNLLLSLIALDGSYKPVAAQTAPAETCTDETAACRWAHSNYWSVVLETPGDKYWQHRSIEQLVSTSLEVLKDIPAADTFELLAEVYDALGRYSEAVEQWKIALELSPRDVRVQKALAESLARSRANGSRQVQ